LLAALLNRPAASAILRAAFQALLATTESFVGYATSTFWLAASELSLTTIDRCLRIVRFFFRRQGDGPSSAHQQRGTQQKFRNHEYSPRKLVKMLKEPSIAHRHTMTHGARVYSTTPNAMENA
jgi:hypothetical protein